MQSIPPNQTGKKGGSDRPKVLFETGFERLSTLAERGPLSLATLYRLAASGRLKTTKLAGARVVTRASWNAFVASGEAA